MWRSTFIRYIKMRRTIGNIVVEQAFVHFEPSTTFQPDSITLHRDANDENVIRLMKTFQATECLIK
ncbi:unnamed protein product [Heterobilharzia americana]|nr:unnamed protein product [Heterobilharzia americana]